MVGKIEQYEMSFRNTFRQLLLIIAPWLVFWVVDDFWPGLLRLSFGPMRTPVFVALAPFEIFLAVGVIIAWKRNFPLWSYTWIGTLYFFVYREIFQIIIQSAPRLLPENPELIIHGFYWIVNPLGLALLLALITRRDWLFACFTAYPYNSIIQAWYTLDRTPLLILSTSLILYSLFAVLFMALKSRTLKFTSLLAGTLIIGGGFFIYRWDLLIGGLRSFLFIVGRILLILLFPLVIHKIPLYHRLFKTNLS
ncbi:MAG: hypothetical protein ACETVZ_07465 [Phycisphaerae bacterium]